MKATSTRSPRNGVRISGIRTSRPRRAYGRRPSGEPCIRGPWDPFCSSWRARPSRTWPSPSPSFPIRGKRGERGPEFVVRHGRNGGCIQHKNPFRPLGGVSGEGSSPNNQTRAASQPSLIVWRSNYTIGPIIHHLPVYLAF